MTTAETPCSDRQVLGKITADGVFLAQLETDPARVPFSGIRVRSAQN